MNNRVKSLEVRNEVIKLIEEKFEMKFSYSFNDLYKVKDDFIVRRLKGGLYNMFDLNKFGYVNMNNNKDLRDEFNNLILKVDDYLKSLNYEGFEIRLKKKKLSFCKSEKESFEKYYNIILSMKEYKEILNEKNGDLILSIKMKDN
jgi:hypothetical protein